MRNALSPCMWRLARGTRPSWTCHPAFSNGCWQTCMCQDWGTNASWCFSYICLYMYVYIYNYIYIYTYIIIYYIICLKFSHTFFVVLEGFSHRYVPDLPFSDPFPGAFCWWIHWEASRIAILGISWLYIPLRYIQELKYPEIIKSHFRWYPDISSYSSMKSMKWIEMVGCLKSNAMKSINSREISSEIWHGCHIPWSPSKFPAYHCLSAISTARGCWALRRRLTCEIRPGRWVDPKMMIYMMFIYIYMYIYRMV